MITGEYPPMLGGVGSYTQLLARALRDQGHLVSVFTRQEAAASAEGGIEVKACIGQRWDRSSHTQIQDWATKWQPDIVSIQFQTAAFNMLPAIHFTATRLRPTPTAVTFHDLRVPYLFPKAGPLREAAVRLLARSASGVIATDEADLLRLSAWGIEGARWIPIGSNIQPCHDSSVTPQQVRARFGIPGGAVMIAYFGFLNESKGALVLIEALDILRNEGLDAHVLMIGELLGASDPANRAYAQTVAARIEQLSLVDYVHWTGYSPDEVVSAGFYAADLVALPYLDGVSLRRGTLMAALVHGKAIVSTQAGEPPALLHDALELCPPGDAALLAAAILHLWQNPARRERLARAAAAAGQHFDWGRIASRCVEYYDSILRSTRL